MKYIRKINLRDFFISIYYGIAVPVLFEVQNLIATGGFSLTKENIVEKLGMLVISAVLAHIIRKSSKNHNLTQSIKLMSSNEEEEFEADPPPIGGDPIKPPKK